MGQISSSLFILLLVKFDGGVWFRWGSSHFLHIVFVTMLWVKLTYTRSSYIWIQSATQMTLWKHFVFNCWWVNKLVCYIFMEILRSWGNTYVLLGFVECCFKGGSLYCKCYISNSKLCPKFHLQSSFELCLFLMEFALKHQN
jgi:hypothetical protein